MRIKLSQLRQIIKEEVAATAKERPLNEALFGLVTTKNDLVELVANLMIALGKLPEQDVDKSVLSKTKLSDATKSQLKGINGSIKDTKKKLRDLSNQLQSGKIEKDKFRSEVVGLLGTPVKQWKDYTKAIEDAAKTLKGEKASKDAAEAKKGEQSRQDYRNEKKWEAEREDAARKARSKEASANWEENRKADEERARKNRGKGKKDDEPFVNRAGGGDRY